MRLADLADKTFSTIERGAPDLVIRSATALEIAEPGDISFLANLRYGPLVVSTRASAIFVSEGVAVDRDDIAILRTTDAQLAYARAVRLFFPERDVKPFVHPTAVIDPTANVADDVEIHANAVIGANCKIASGVRIMPNVTIYDGSQIGENTTLHSGVSIRENCEIGRNCIIHNNSTIGSDGFGYAIDEQKRWVKIPQTGRVVIEDDVEIGANTAIDRSSAGDTRIGRGVKIDNLVQIAHSCSVDDDALICSQTGIAGSSHIGKRVVLAGQVGIAGHLKVGDDAVLTAKSATSHDVGPGKIMSGVPAFDNRDWLRSTAAFRKLGEMAQRLRKIEKRVFGDETQT
jgi:UDP-3-O-[3-hydroxymyristoyl] glucosamine N-acyltransferase